MINVKSYLWLKTVNIGQSESNLIECNYERGTEMTTEEIVQNYQVKLLKIIFKEIDSLMKKKEKADINASKLAENGYSVRTSAPWK